MKIRVGYVFAAMLLLAGCAASNDTEYNASNTVLTPGAAPPQRVEAVSDALGARMNTMLGGSSVPNSVTR